MQHKLTARTVVAVLAVPVVLATAACTQPSSPPVYPTETVSPGPSLTPVPTTPAQVPSGGTIEETVTPQPEAAAVTEAPLEAAVTPAAGWEISIARVAGVTAEPIVPGDAGGAAIQVDVVVTNSGREPLDTSAITVNALDAQGRAGTPIETADSSPLPDELAPGATATGVYVIGLATDARESVRITVSSLEGVPDVVFEGSVE